MKYLFQPKQTNKQTTKAAQTHKERHDRAETLLGAQGSVCRDVQEQDRWFQAVKSHCKGWGGGTEDACGPEN